MDYNFYIFGAYAAATLLVGGLVAETLLAARRAARTLRRVSDESQA